MTDNNFHALNCRRLTFFSKLTFSKDSVWIQIMTNILSALIWVQSVCKCYHLMTKVAASNESVKLYNITGSF